MNNITSDNNTAKTEIKEGMSFEEMLDSYTKPPRAGERVQGVITSVTPAAIYVDLGIKHTGVLPSSEVTDDPSVDIMSEYKVGDEIEVQIVKYNDPAVLREIYNDPYVITLDRVTEIFNP